MALGLTQPLTQMGTRECFWGVERGWRLRQTSPQFVSRLSRHCRSLDVSQPYRPPQFVPGIALLFLNVGYNLIEINEMYTHM
jgi:hypothetical protein